MSPPAPGSAGSYEVRIHGQLDDRAPAEVEAAWQSEHTATPNQESAA
jgi:hypothetical protein